MEKRDEKHFVLVHGACHGAWCWYKVATLLKAAGHKVTALDMAASGIHPKQAHQVSFFSEYIEPLIDFLASVLPGEKVILVGHSWGGACISAAMERLPEKIYVAVFAAAVMPGPHLSLSVVVDEYNRRLDSYVDTQFTYDQGPENHPTTILFGPKFMASRLYQLSPPEDLTLALSLVRPLRLHADIAGSIKDSEVTEEKYGSVHRVYIICNQDNVMREDFQRWMIEKTPADDVKLITGSDHMVMFCKPLELSSCLQEIAKKYSKKF